MDRISTKGMAFTDQYGRTRILRGLNYKHHVITSQKPEEAALPDLDETFFRDCREAGFNCLRLGVMWENLEPEKGQYNETYLAAIDRVFALAEQYGVYVFLDMHQDLYSSFGVHNGDGAPPWATVTDGHKQPEHAKLVWAEGYFWGKAVHAAFDHFWNNDPVLGKGLLDHFCELWQMLARRYANCPAFLGFDLLNEPFPGADGGRIFRKLVGKLLGVIAVSPAIKRRDFFRALKEKTPVVKAALDRLTPEAMAAITPAGLPLVRKFDLERYTPFVQKVTDAIRQVTDKGVIIMENSYYSNLGIPYSAEKPRREAETVFAPHAYDFMVDTPAYAWADNGRVGWIFEEHRRSQERLQVPVLVGEWGSGAPGTGWLPHIDFLLNRFADWQWSDVYFAYQKGMFAKESGNHRAPVMDVLKRPYPIAVAGSIGSYSYAMPEKRFRLNYAADGSILEPTVVYLPAAPQEILLSDGASYTVEGQELRINAPAGAVEVSLQF
ncbi:MAG: cellulase family glycosylhydrolase [Oscillospiraceae bacterium]|nr:cellulase family glycosylhydrolase [Oscillospiraceae bacterium]